MEAVVRLDTIEERVLSYHLPVENNSGWLPIAGVAVLALEILWPEIVGGFPR